MRRLHLVSSKSVQCNWRNGSRQHYTFFFTPYFDSRELIQQPPISKQKESVKRQPRHEVSGINAKAHRVGRGGGDKNASQKYFFYLNLKHGYKVRVTVSKGIL